MLLSFEPRQQVPAALLYAASPLAVLATVVASALVFAGMGYPPGPTLYAFFLEPLLGWNSWSEVLLKAAPPP
jgi:ABC-type uncharacterized transport system permease subunit